MRKRSRTRWQQGRIVLSLALLGEACTSYRPVPSIGPAEGQAVRVGFDSPRTVIVRMPGGDSLLLARVVDLTGPVARRAGDTLVLRVWSARDARLTELHPPPGGTAAVVQGRGVVLTERTHDSRATRRALLAVVGAAVVLGWAFYEFLKAAARD